MTKKEFWKEIIIDIDHFPDGYEVEGLKFDYRAAKALEKDGLISISDWDGKTFYCQLTEIGLKKAFNSNKALPSETMKIQIEKSKLEQLLREIRHAHSEGFRACQFTEAREEDLFACSAAAKVIDNYGKEFNIKTNTIQ